MIQLLHAAFVYQSPDGEVEALRDVSFDVQEGEFCSIVGPSGCGKSTLLSALAGLEPLTGGRVELKGEPVCGPSVYNWSLSSLSERVSASKAGRLASLLAAALLEALRAVRATGG